MDIPWVFRQGAQDEVIHMVLRGPLLIYSLNVPRVIMLHSVARRTMRLMKGLYGCLRAAIQFWKKLSSQPVTWGFTINPYDCCVANKQVNGKQLVVMWHVDDLKLSLQDPMVLDALLQDLNATFGKEAPLVTNTTKRHDYLGVMLDCSKPGQVTVDMHAYIDGILKEASEEMLGVATTPAAEHLF